MANIVTVAVPAFIEESSEYDTQYKRTMKWNPEKGDFVRNAANQVVECTGEEGYMIWCMKVSMTERYSCLAYSNDIGVEMRTHWRRTMKRQSNQWWSEPSEMHCL